MVFKIVKRLNSLKNPTPTRSAPLRFHPELPPEALQALQNTEEVEELEEPNSNTKCCPTVSPRIAPRSCSSS
jgi:hypothetical protein